MRKPFIAACMLMLLDFASIKSYAQTDINPKDGVTISEVSRLMTSASIIRNEKNLSSFGDLKFDEAIVKPLNTNGSDSINLIVVPLIKDGRVVASVCLQTKVD